MITGYLNYPNSKKNIHRSGCHHIDKHNSPTRRNIKVDADTISAIVKQFQNNEIPFASEAQTNDLIIEFDFSDEDFEIASFEFLTKQLEKRYKSFGEIHRCNACFKGHVQAVNGGE